MKRFLIGSLFAVCPLSILVAAQQKPAAPDTESKELKISRALSAAPASIAKGAKVVDRDAEGNETTLREGNNGFTCFPGHPGVIGDAALCANAPALQWEVDMAQHKPKPTNTEPGIEYMLAGATDWSATDPHATSGTPIKEPPHWMIMWPVDGTSGLATTAKQTGTWIMYAGTPWAHLMINQQP
jgi:hypothetical protein